MARWATHRKDENHAPIVAALEARGARFWVWGEGGKPDGVVAHRGRAWPVEFKMPDGDLTDDQERVFPQFAAAGWPVKILRTVEDAHALLDGR